LAEICAIEIEKVVFISVYTQPEDNSILIEQLEGLHDQILKEGKTAVIMGDFNAHHESWLGSESKTNKRGLRLKEFCDLHGLNNLITEPTRGKNFLDLVISPSEGEFELLPNIGTSDHMALKISLDLGMKGIKIPEITGRKVYHWSSANFREMNAELKRCSFDFERLSVQESVDLVTHTLCELTDKYIPSVMISGTAKPTAWWTPYCQWAWERKQRAFIGGCKVGIMRATKCCVQVCRRAFAKHQLWLKIRLQRAKGSKKWYWWWEETEGDNPCCRLSEALCHEDELAWGRA
jgi:hypothetical protein